MPCAHQQRGVQHTTVRKLGRRYSSMLSARTPRLPHRCLNLWSPHCEAIYSQPLKTQRQTCMAEVAPLHEVVLDDGEILLDKGS